MRPHPAPMLSCLETKLTLSGETNHYSCELLHYEPGFGILRYVIDREYDIHGFPLSPGDKTVALYWEDRPYTLYIWRTNAGETAHYFNIADRIALSPEKFVWRDLVVDVLVDRRGPCVLDEHELPADIEPSLASSIQAATALVLMGHRTIIEEADALVRKYDPPAA